MASVTTMISTTWATVVSVQSVNCSRTSTESVFPVWKESFVSEWQRRIRILLPRSLWSTSSLLRQPWRSSSEALSCHSSWIRTTHFLSWHIRDVCQPLVRVVCQEIVPDSRFEMYTTHIMVECVQSRHLKVRISVWSTLLLRMQESMSMVSLRHHTESWISQILPIRLLQMKLYIWQRTKRIIILLHRRMSHWMRTVTSRRTTYPVVSGKRHLSSRRQTLIWWTYHQRWYSLLLHPWFLSWRTMMQTVPSWDPTCSVRQCHFFVQKLRLLEQVWNPRLHMTLESASQQEMAES